MSSLLTQMRPAPSEQVERREGTRKYQPDYRLSRHVTVPTRREALDPKPPPFTLRKEGPGPRHAYVTPHGPLATDLMDQFARHHQWKLRHSSVTCVIFRPSRADMVRFSWPGRRPAGGPFEYQKIVANRGQLPEAKAWPRVQEEHRPFPHNSFKGEKLFREVRHNIGGRTPEDTERVKNHIRQLVKDDKLNTQFVKPLPRYTGLQDEVRIYEGLERPAGRNPVHMTTEYMAQFDRHIPSKEYTRPKFAADNPLSRTVVLQRPFNHFNQVEHPHFLDYLPTPYNVSSKPHDLRLV